MDGMSQLSRPTYLGKIETHNLDFARIAISTERMMGIFYNDTGAPRPEHQYLFIMSYAQEVYNERKSGK